MRCVIDSFPVSKFWEDQRLIDFSPPYQRVTGVWGSEKKGLLIDSILNGFDIPKVYFHVQPPGGKYRWAVVDGKQRLTTIIDFIEGHFPLNKSFVFSGETLEDGQAPLRGQYWSQLGESAKNRILRFSLAATLITEASQEDVQQLFMRLNDGVKLNDAEYRQGLGGQVIWMIGELERHEFFNERVGFSDKRFDYKEVACRLLLIEFHLLVQQRVPSLKKANLDRFVIQNANISDAEAEKLVSKVSKNLDWISGCFPKKSRDLSKGSVQLFYFWLRQVKEELTDELLKRKIMQSVEAFAALRIEQKVLELENQNPAVTRYLWLSGQNTNDPDSLVERAKIHSQMLLEKFPEISLKDKKRSFREDQRYLIWVRGGKACASCGTILETLAEMHADHVVPHSKGGATSVANGQPLCASCNLRKGAN